MVKVLRRSSAPSHAVVLAVVLAVVVGLLTLPAVPAGAADVHGDDERDRYVGTGGLILPPSVAPGVRRQVAECPDCAWRLTTPCIESGLGNPFDGQSACRSVVRGCPGGYQLLRSWFRGPGQGWREVGLVCIGPGGPLTVAEAEATARARVERGIPRLRPTFEPTHSAVTQIPVVFGAGQPAGPQSWQWALGAERVDVTATPAWTWSFGDGARFVTDDPGGRYPRATVAHAYRTSGEREVVVRARWSAQFTVAGFGPFPVREPVEQVAAVQVPVGQGQALLTPG